MVIFIEAIIESYNHLKKNWLLIPLAAFFDLIFFLLLGLGTGIAGRASAPAVTAILQSAGTLQNDIVTAISQGQSAFDAFLSNPTVALHIKSLLGIAVYFIVALYVMWIVFNGASWYLSSRIMGVKTTLTEFFTKFSIVSLVWFGIISVILAALIRFALSILLQPEHVITSQFIIQYANILNYVLFYFVLISFSLVPYTTLNENIRKTFRYGIKEAPIFLITIAIIVVVLYLNFKITFLIFESVLKAATSLNTSVLLINFIRFIIAAPFLLWARIYLMTVAKETAKIQHQR